MMNKKGGGSISQYIASFSISLINEQYSLYIETPNGKNIRGGNLVLRAKLYRNNVDVTNEWEDKYFIWERHSVDEYGDMYWNNAHTIGTKEIIITGNDVKIEADFECRFEADGISVSSS